MTTTYLSRRTVRGYPYLATCRISLRTRRDCVQVWWPEGPCHRPDGAVPHNWYREGTARAAAAIAMHADAPRPWETIDQYMARTGISRYHIESCARTGVPL